MWKRLFVVCAVVVIIEQLPVELIVISALVEERMPCSFPADVKGV